MSSKKFKGARKDTYRQVTINTGNTRTAKWNEQVFEHEYTDKIRAYVRNGDSWLVYSEIPGVYIKGEWSADRTSYTTHWVWRSESGEYIGLLDQICRLENDRDAWEEFHRSHMSDALPPITGIMQEPQAPYAADALLYGYSLYGITALIKGLSKPGALGSMSTYISSVVLDVMREVKT